MIPDRCVLRVDCRILPNQDPEHVIEDVQRVLDDLMAGDPELKAELAVVLRGDPVEVDEGEHVVGAIQSAIRDVIGHDLPLGGVGSTSDMRFIVNNAHIPMCKFMFPTSETGTNENESIEDFLNTVKVYAMLILNEIC
jgi:acetylornithine deacetylase/succinyl-diaminopimelate desuccinylase-like protein